MESILINKLVDHHYSPERIPLEEIAALIIKNMDEETGVTQIDIQDEIINCRQWCIRGEVNLSVRPLWEGSTHSSGPDPDEYYTTITSEIYIYEVTGDMEEEKDYEADMLDDAIQRYFNR